LLFSESLRSRPNCSKISNCFRPTHLFANRSGCARPQIDGVQSRLRRRSFQVQDPKTGADLWALPVTEQGEKKPFVLINSPFSETQGQLSPDGRLKSSAKIHQGSLPSRSAGRIHPECSASCGLQVTFPSQRKGDARSQRARMARAAARSRRSGCGDDGVRADHGSADPRCQEFSHESKWEEMRGFGGFSGSWAEAVSSSWRRFDGFYKKGIWVSAHAALPIIESKSDCLHSHFCAGVT
jgi:hypothetical protein